MADLGLKASFKIGNNLVGSLKSIGGLEVSVNPVDVTVLNSPDNYDESTPGRKSVSDVTIEGNYAKNDVGQIALATAVSAGTVDVYTVTFSSGATLVFSGFPTSLQTVGEANLDDPLGFSCTLKVTGKPVFTEAV